jgi:Trk-type K+ transport system membrane component
VLAWFVLAMIAGTLLLMLPVASASGRGAGFSTAMFTAIAAVCVTGLHVVDPGTYWSGTGQVVILLLMQFGGVGVMWFASLVGLLVADRLGLRSRMLAPLAPAPGEAGRVGGIGGAVSPATSRRLFLGVLRISLAVEAVVWLVLWLRLEFGYGERPLRAAWLGLFHAVSAYTNTGLALWPDNLQRFAGDGWVLLPLLAAVVLGGIGYPVWHELLRARRGRTWSVHVRLTVITTAVLLVLGPFAVFLTERHTTLAGLDGAHQALAALFSGVGPRTSGFATIDYSHADPGTLLITAALMFIGGGSASAAGGIKVTTLAVLSLAVASELRGRTDVEAFGRRIDGTTVRQALTVVMLAMVVIAASTLALLELSSLEVGDALFETVSAFATAGLATGRTGGIPTSGHNLLLVLMLVGRFGTIVLASGLAVRERRRLVRYPQARPLVG